MPKPAYLNSLVQGQMYWPFPFSKDSLPVLLNLIPYRNKLVLVIVGHSTLSYIYRQSWSLPECSL
jgi:hypothetical protein